MSLLEVQRLDQIKCKIRCSTTRQIEMIGYQEL
jgi:hypothetical protein